ncbi:MAG TPA: glutamate synthase [Isosphaeraceae bacterium]|nr:glutamate synthase [Isosphaeraceae bacterium]
MDDSRALDRPAAVVLAVPEIRDYRAINQELVRHLDRGCPSIRLTGALGQRLLASGLRGRWSAMIEIEGDAGPELAAGLDAPGLTVVCRGSAGDGAASGLKAGRVLVLGRVGTAVGYAQGGGLIMVAGTAGARAGLGQLAGDLILIGGAGPLAGERQSGGRLIAQADLGPHAGRGRRGGRFLRLDQRREPLAESDRAALEFAFTTFASWLGPKSTSWPPG